MHSGRRIHWTSEVIHLNIVPLDNCLLPKPAEAVIKSEPEEVIEKVGTECKPAEDPVKLTRRRPVRRASKKILQDANPELVRPNNIIIPVITSDIIYT